MQRYFIHLSYDGTAYNGWQVQENTPHTVQQVLNDTFSKLLGEEILITGCGRTDTGVHASDFYAHFDSAIPDLHLNQYKWVYKLNNVLPKDIALHNIMAVAPEANSRFDACLRTYQYIICKKKNPFQVNKAYLLPQALDVALMNQAASKLFEHADFSAFSKSHTQTLSNNCKIHTAEWVEENDLLIFTISADRFLRNMVRAIVGTLLDVGKGKITLDNFVKIIESKNRSNAGFSVPACGLYLTKVEYPSELFVVQQA